MVHAVFAVALVCTAALFALVEVQIEGVNGWASSLPTWRVQNRWTRLLLGNRALTGYHVYFHLFMLSALHAVYGIAPAAFSLGMELRILAFAVLFWVAEDCLWFVLNPSYGWRSFNRVHAWWHAASWWWVMPRDYWFFTPAGIALYLLSWRV